MTTIPTSMKMRTISTNYHVSFVIHLYGKDDMRFVNSFESIDEAVKFRDKLKQWRLELKEARSLYSQPSEEYNAFILYKIGVSGYLVSVDEDIWKMELTRTLVEL